MIATPGNTGQPTRVHQSALTASSHTKGVVHYGRMLEVTWYARTSRAPGHPISNPLNHTNAKGVRCKSMTLKEACSVPKHTSAMCVQSFDDSLNSAIHTTYRISLRSSSLREPRYPLSRVLVTLKTRYIRYRGAQKWYKTCIESHNTCVARRLSQAIKDLYDNESPHIPHDITVHKGWYGYHDNDPSAGSPTETLLRLLLPLDDKVRSTSRSHASQSDTPTAIQSSHRTIQSVAATGGVYKGQGRNQGGLLNHPY